MTRLTVADVMTRNVVAVRTYAGYKDIADALARYRLSAVPVIGDADHVVGVVSEADLLSKLEYPFAGTGPRLLARRWRRVARRKAAGFRAADLMSTPPITTPPGASVVAGARRMDSAKIKRLPVVDEQERLVGIVSRADLVRVFLRPDDVIRTEVIERVLRRVLRVTTGEVDVQVRDGVVTLAGQVERTSMIELAERLARDVDGVVAVVNRLTSDHDDNLEEIFEAMARPDPAHDRTVGDT